MDTALVCMLIVFWYMIGVTSFIFHWTREFDFTKNDCVAALFVGITGPIAFLMGFLIHPIYKKKNKILIKRR